MTERGCFIVFEGIDRAGKSTQAEILAGKLSSSAKRVRFPNYDTPSGQILLSYLKSKVDMDARTAHLLFAANRAECVAEITKFLNNGVTVVCDRYVLSGVAYSVAKGLDVDWCFAVERGLPKPDLVFLLSVDVDAVEKRSEFGSDRHDKKEFLNKVQTAYQTIKSRVNTVEILATDMTIEKVAKLVEQNFSATTKNQLMYFD